MINLFNDFKKKFGGVIYRGVELAFTQYPYPDGADGDRCFRADAMDKDGNLWEVIWYPKSDADGCDDYASQVEDWCFRVDAMDKDGNLWEVIWYPKSDASRKEG